MNSTCHNFNFEGEASRFNLIAHYLDKSAVFIETLSDDSLKEKLKSCISQIEDLILQSPEWIYNNGLPGINIGMFGSFDGGWKELLSVFAKSNEHDCIEDMGIRVKSFLKLNENRQFLLLIRHESENIPNMEFSNWLDCGIVVFKLENERSYKDALLSHKEFISLRSQDCKHAPMILVGCKDSVSSVSPRLKSYVEMKLIAQKYKFDEYFEVRYCDRYNTSFLLEYCTILADKYKFGNNKLRGNVNISPQPFISTESNGNEKRKSNKRKTCTEDDFKVPMAAVSNKTVPKSAKRNSSINDPPNGENERKYSNSFFKSKAKSLPRPQAQESNSYYSSNGSLNEQNYATLNRRYVSMIQLPNKKSRWRFFYRKKPQSSKNAVETTAEIVIQGNLYKSGNKKWVTITHKPSMFYHNSKHDFEKGVKGKEIPLLSSNVKVPGNNCQNGYTTKINKRKSLNEEDKKTISIITHVGKHNAQTRHFKANSEEERNNWLDKIKDAIYRSYSGGIIDKTNQIPLVIVDDVMSKNGNDVCADCSAKNPKWLVYNFGILVCERCAGGHRKLSTDISKVSSSQLDDVDKIKKLMLESFGNTLVNSVLEAKLALTNDTKPEPGVEPVEEWLRKKYVLKSYKAPLPLPAEDLHKQLILAIQDQDRQYQLICLMNAEKEQLNLPYDEKDSRTALMIGAFISDIVSVQLLLWAGVDTTIKDNNGLNALSFASINITEESVSGERIEVQKLLKKYNTPIQLIQKIK